MFSLLQSFAIIIIDAIVLVVISLVNNGLMSYAESAM
jgi:hypothetical protein